MPPFVGKVADSDHCPPALAQAIVEKNLVVFCGAGISMAAPSALPSWDGFNEALFRQIKLRAAMLAGLSSEARKILEAMSVTTATGQNAQVVPTEGFSDQVLDLLLSEQYFPALKVLDGERCNGNHNALAQLAKAGIVRAIVTTNFDTLIERAFTAIDLKFDRFISHHDYDRGGIDPARTALYKIHGSVDVPDSLKDTATQKFRGLAFYVHARLAELFCNHHVLVIGSSGGDLKFGDDYLSFGQMRSKGPGITWVVRPPEKPEDPLVSERVRGLLESAGDKAAIAVRKLPDLFSELGVPRELFNVGNEDPRVAKARANERAAAYLHTFFETKALAPLSCASFCATLLRGVGRSDSARTIENALTKTLQDIGDDLAVEDALNVAQVVAALARAACDDGEYNLGNDLALRVLKLADRVEAQGSRKSPEDIFLWNKLRSIAWNFRGLCFLNCNQTKEAAASLSEAKRLIDPNGGDVALLSIIQINEAYLRWRMGAPNDEVLQLARRGTGLARRAGDMGALTAAAQLESAILFPLGEYDVALRALTVGLSAISVSGNARQRAGLETEMAKIALARGEIESAFKRMQDLMGELSEHPIFRASLFMQTAKALGFHPPLRDRLLQMANTVLTDFQNDRIPAEGGPNVPARAQVEQVRDDLVANRLPENRLLQKDAAPPRNREEQLRRLIIEHEATGRHSELPKCFLELFDDRLGHVDPSRLLDFALGLGCAAERAHDHDLQLVACCQRMLAWQQLGELRRALDEFGELRVDGSASAQTTLAAIRAMAGSLHGLIGTAEEGERLLQSARELNVQANNLSAAATNAFSIARLAARNNDYARAIEILQNARESVYALSDPTLVEKFERMLDHFQRGCGRKQSAMPLTIGLREPLRKARLTAGDIPHLRSIVASPEDLLLLARFALGSGLPQEARELTLEASLSFGELRDTCEIADCLSFLADIAQMQRQWEKAFEFSQMAAAACSQIGDQMREVASLAVLAFCLYKLEEFREAGNVAERCLLRAEGQAVSRPVLIASFVGAAACDKNGDLLGKFRLVTCFLRAYPLAQAVDDLAPLRDSFQRMLKPAATST